MVPSRVGWPQLPKVESSKPAAYRTFYPCIQLAHPIKQTLSLIQLFDDNIASTASSYTTKMYNLEIDEIAGYLEPIIRKKIKISFYCRQRFQLGISFKNRPEILILYNSQTNVTD